MIMKTIINKAILFLSILLVASSCDDVEHVMLNENANTTVSLSTSSVVLTEETAPDDAVTVSWTSPEFGFAAAPTYRVLIDHVGGDFTDAQAVSAGVEMEKTFTVQELNSKLLSLELEPLVEDAVDIRVETRLSSSQIFLSNPVTLTVTPYSSVLDLSTTWGVVGSATPGGWGTPDIPDLPFYTTSESGVLVAYVTLRDGEIKFRENNDWTLNYGDTGLDGTLDDGGDNIPVSAGSYRILMNLNTLTYTMETYSWGIVGSAAPNGWDGPDAQFTYNPYQNNWKAVVTLIEGEIKFRRSNDWGLNYGDSGLDGTLDEGGDNIPVTAGHYLVTLDLNNLTYTLEETDVWGLVGSATPNGWDGPDQKFLPDFGINEGFFYIHGAELIAGEIKVRQNDNWAVNYGDDGADGTLELNGANIMVEAGIYNITVNFSVDPPTITINPYQ